MLDIYLICRHFRLRSVDLNSDTSQIAQDKDRLYRIQNYKLKFSYGKEIKYRAFYDIMFLCIWYNISMSYMVKPRRSPLSKKKIENTSPYIYIQISSMRICQYVDNWTYNCKYEWRGIAMIWGTKARTSQKS